MRTLVVASLTISTLAVLAGCMGTSPAPSPGLRDALAGGWQLDCSMGSHERDLGAQWLQDCEARASHTNGPKAEIWLAVNPKDPNNVVIGAKDLNPAASAKCVWNGLSVTKDGGKSWTDVIIGGPFASRTPTSPYYGYACNTDPMGVFDAAGTLHWVVEMYNLGGQDGFGPVPPLPGGNGRGVLQPGWKLVLAHSTDGGLTFPDEATTTLEYGDGVGLLNDYSRVTVNPSTGTVVTVINSYYPATGSNAVPLPVASVLCSVLPYRGPGVVQSVPVNPATQATALPPTVATGSGNPGGYNCNGVAANALGTIVLGAIGTDAPVTGSVLSASFATSTDDANSFSDFTKGFEYHPIPGQFEESAYRTGTNFELAFDNTNGPHKGTLYAITAEDSTKQGGGPARQPTSGVDDADIYVRSSTDNGATWSGAIQVNHDATISHQFEPNIVVAGDGSVHAFWMDKAYDLAAHHSNATGKDCAMHCWIDVTHAVSLDGGRNWTNERVTQVTWDGELGKHQEGFPFIGDYTGIGASGNTVWAGFADASLGGPSLVTAIRVVNNDLA